jgi:predicted PurR-regulated permease PerM
MTAHDDGRGSQSPSPDDAAKDPDGGSIPNEALPAGVDEDVDADTSSYHHDTRAARRTSGRVETARTRGGWATIPAALIGAGLYLVAAVMLDLAAIPLIPIVGVGVICIGNWGHSWARTLWYVTLITYGLWLVADTVSIWFPFFLALVFAYIVSPIVNWMSRLFQRLGMRTIGRPVAVVVFFVVGLGGFITFDILFYTQVQGTVEQLSERIESGEVQREVAGAINSVSEQFGAQEEITGDDVGRFVNDTLRNLARSVALDSIVGPSPEAAGNGGGEADPRTGSDPPGADPEADGNRDGGAAPQTETEAPRTDRAGDDQRFAQMLGSIGETLGFVGALLFNFVIFLAVAFFFLLNWERLTAGLRDYFSPRSGRRLHELSRSVSKIMRQYLQGHTLVCICVGLIFFSVLKLFQHPYADLLGLLMGIFTFIPFLGPIIGGLTAVLLTLTVPGDQLGISLASVVVGYIVAHGINDLFLYPTIAGRAVKLNAVVTLLVLFIAEHFFGILGMFFAVPIAAIIRETIRWINQEHINGFEWLKIFRSYSDRHESVVRRGAIERAEANGYPGYTPE